jgi:hypothetical protein
VLQLFRINDPYRMALMLALMLAAFIPLLFSPSVITHPVLHSLLVGEARSAGLIMYAEIIDSTAPLAAAAFHALDFLFGRALAARSWVAFFILFFQAAFFARMLIINRVYADSTYVPGLIFAVLCFLSFDFFTVTPVLPGSALLLVAMHYLFREVEFREQRQETIFSLGFYLGLATLCVFSYVIFLIGIAVLLLVYGRFTGRKAMLLLAGFAFPHLLVITYGFYRGHLPELVSAFYASALAFSTTVYLSWASLFWLAVAPLGYLVFSLFLMSREARFTRYQSQLFQIMFWWMVMAVAECLVTRQRTAQSLIVFLPPAAYFISYYLLLIRRRWMAEWLTRIFIAAVFTGFYVHRTDLIRWVDYRQLRMQVPERPREIHPEKWMVLSGDRSVYRWQALGGGFIDWTMSRELLASATSMETVERIHRIIIKNPPDVIWDPEDWMARVWPHMPRLAARYKKDGDKYFLAPASDR